MPKTDKNRNRNPNLSKGENKPSAFSYHSQRSVRDDAPKGFFYRVRQFWHALPAVLGLVLLAAGLLYSLSLDMNPSIKIVSSTDGSQSLMREPADYKQAATEIMGESIFYGNKLTFAQERFEKKMLAEFSELSSVSVTMGLISRRPEVVVVVRTPAFYISDTGGNTFLVDLSGEVSLPLTETAAELRSSLPRVADEGSERLQPGESVLTKSDTEFIVSLVALLEKAKQPLEKATLTTQLHELHVDLKGAGYFVKFNTLEDVRTQVGTLLATQQHLKEQGITPPRYIDVRVEGRSFYN